MSWYLHDANGYVGDFGTHVGIREMLSLRDKPALRELIVSGVADANTVDRIVGEVQDVPSLAYLGKMLTKAKPPVTINDGIEEG
jgi:hypothetical protein